MTTTDGADTLPDSFEWSVRPLEYEPQKAWGIAAGSALAWVLGVAMGGSWILGVVAVAIVLGATAEFWMGSKYRVSEHDVRARTGLSLSVLAWEDVKRVVESEAGVLFSPLEEASWRDAFRGVFVRWPKEGEEPLRVCVRRYWVHG